MLFHSKLHFSQRLLVHVLNWQRTPLRLPCHVPLVVVLVIILYHRVVLVAYFLLQPFQVHVVVYFIQLFLQNVFALLQIVRHT